MKRGTSDEVAGFLAEHSGLHDEQGRRLVVRNGSLPEREILTGAGSQSTEFAIDCGNGVPVSSFRCLLMIHRLRILAGRILL